MKHTIDQLPIVLTQGVSFEFEKDLADLLDKVSSEYDNQPDVRTNGDNDKNLTFAKIMERVTRRVQGSGAQYYPS